jgi:N-acyl amino acid synthase of PEP-CTERM/exosortase system
MWYFRYMHFKKIDSPELLQEVYKLRFQVYARECRFISADDYPEGMERDAYDEHAVHFGAFDEEGQIIGAVRLILPSSEKFLIEERCGDLPFDDGLPSRHLHAEISRLTISKSFRRLLAPNNAHEDKTGAYIRKVSPLALGLCHMMYDECRERGIAFCLALMEKPLALLLKLNGFQFKPIGPAVDFFGPVTPYILFVNHLSDQDFM